MELEERMTFEVKFEEYDLDENFVRILKGINLENFELMALRFVKEQQTIIIQIKPTEEPLTLEEELEIMESMGMEFHDPNEARKIKPKK